MLDDTWNRLQLLILELEQEGLVTRTFRRLDRERQQAVIDGIFADVAERGTVGIKEVARRAGVSVGSLYQYFGSRDRMFDFAVELSVRTTRDVLAESEPWMAQTPLRDALRFYIKGGLEWSTTQAGMMRFLARGAYQGDPALVDRVVTPIATAMRKVVQVTLEGAIARGEVRSDVDLEATIGILNTLIIAVSDSQALPHLDRYFQLTNEDVPIERSLEAMIEMVVSGLEPPRDPK